MTMTDEGPRTGPPAEAEADSAEPEEVTLSSPLRIGLLVAGVIALGVLVSVPAVIVVLAIVVMIFFHELGHYLTAKAAGMKVTEFFIGFGPRIWSFRRGETEYGIKALPAGAYVKIIGMTNLDEVDPADENRTYRHKPYWRRLSVAVAGSAMHFLMALLLFFAMFAGFGQRTADNWSIGELSEASELTESLVAGQEFTAPMAELVAAGEVPASAAGLVPGDTIIAGDAQEFASFEDLSAFIRARPGETVRFIVENDGEVRQVQATIGGFEDTETGQVVGFLGVSPDRPLTRMAPLEAAGESVTQFGSVSKESVLALGRFFSPDGLSSFVDLALGGGDDAPEGGEAPTGGPAIDEADENRIISIYGAARIGTQATEEGIVQLLGFLALLNIFIGVFNLVPLLPLDGGHVAVATYERIREWRSGERYYADITKLLPLTYLVVFVLLSIGMLALYVDIVDPVNLR